jgi:assimilatory nitrate reductase catalytic subunit
MPSNLKLPALRAWDGPLTDELVRAPGKFGLGQVPRQAAPDATTTMVCGFCATGCGLNIHLKNGQAANLSPTTAYPVNVGMACPKGWEALSPLAAPNRATRPLLRVAKGGDLLPVSWETAAAEFCRNFKAIGEKYGPESVAYLSTGQICSEEMALLGAFAKFGMGVLHGDGNTRQCMATAVTAYKQSFGFDAPPYTYQDFEESDVLVFVGSNLCIAHPIMWQRVLRNPHNPEIIVLDPRKTETAAAATRHVALAPKSDLPLLYGLAHVLVREGWVKEDFIHAHTTGYLEFAEFLQAYAPEEVAKVSGISAEEIVDVAGIIAHGKRVSFWWTMGVNQSYQATRTAQAIINLALMTGNIGRPGTGANSITGQCNAMGSRMFSNTTNLLGGHDFTKPAHREKVAATLGLPIERIPAVNSLAYDQIIDGIEEGKIRGLWVIATNPAHSWMHQGRAQRLLEKLDYLVVQDMYRDTDTALSADLVLPAAAWGEKDGTFINSERRVGLVKKVALAPGEALADFWIFKLLAETWGCGELFRDWSDPEATFQILKKLSAGQPCEITGIRDYRHLDEAGGIQWPCLPGDDLGGNQRRLFADGRFFHPDGLARFIFDAPAAMPEPPDAEFPFLLLTGRGTSSQWHTQTRTANSAVLRKLYPREVYIELHPRDAEALGIAENARLRVRSRRAEVTATVFITPTVSPGQVFMPMHYPETNQLTMRSVDPHSRQPNYKACAVALRPG